MSTNDKKRNVYVIDANVFIGADISPFRSFRDAIIVVPMHVLDALEKRIDDRDQGWACKAVINYIERLRASEKDGNKLTTTGVMDKNGNIVIVATTPRATIGMTHSQMTIEITKKQQDERPGQQVTLISNTLSTRVRADEANLHAEPFAGSFKQFDGSIDNVDVELDPSSDIVNSEAAMNKALKGVDKRCQILDMPTPSHAAITFNGCGTTVYLKHGGRLTEYRPNIVRWSGWRRQKFVGSCVSHRPNQRTRCQPTSLRANYGFPLDDRGGRSGSGLFARRTKQQNATLGSSHLGQC